jgi:phosphoglucosamine mutase
VTATRKLFGTDGVRGVAGADLTASLAHRLGAAGARFAGAGGRVLIGRDTRESGVWLEAALVEGVVAAGGRAQSAGVIPTPGVAVLSRRSGAELGAVISASHNPYQDNGIKFIGGDGRKLTDADEQRIEALVGDELEAAGGRAETVEGAADAYVEWLAATYGAGVPAGGALAVDCGNGAAHAVAPALMARLGLAAQAIGISPDGRNINDGVGSTHLDAVARLVSERRLPGGIAFDGDGDRCLAVDSRGRAVNGDAIIAVLAIDRQRRGMLDAGTVVVTSMTNMGFHRLMRESGIGLEVTDVGDRYVLERMTATGATLGGEQSGHVVDLVHHTTGDGLATALMLLAALERLGMTLDDAAELVVPFPQKLVAVTADKARLADAERVWQEVDVAAAKLGQDGRVVVRASGTEPVVRVMVEAADRGECEAICDHLSALVSKELGV